MSLKYPEYANPQLRPRYVGLPTFMRTPYREDLRDVEIALVGVPFDGGVTFRPGAPPPTSRKFAAAPPAYWMMSIVAIARPAPLTMQAMLPSSLM